MRLPRNHYEAAALVATPEDDWPVNPGSAGAVRGKVRMEEFCDAHEKREITVAVIFAVRYPDDRTGGTCPTAEQCRADVDVWGVPRSGILIPNEDQFSNLAGAVMPDQTVTAKTLEARIAELGQCVKTDSVQSVRYSQGSRAYAIAELERMSDFMQRHNMTAQFYQEDDQGKR